MSTPRRLGLLGALAASLVLVSTVPRLAGAFGFDDVAKRAADLAMRSYVEPPNNVADWLGELDYDEYRDIRFRPERALWRDRGLPFTIQFFHPGFYYNRTVQINVVTRAGKVTPVAFSPDQFDYGKSDLGSRVPHDLGYAGFRIHYAIKNPAYQDEVAVFLGASYFRAVGRDQVYGLSARGLALDTASASGEEFSWFREYWLVQPRARTQELTFYALLDSPSVTGAYRIVVAPGPQTRVDVEARLFARKPLHKLGVAPLTSMFLRGEGDAGRPTDDYRPEVHDSDGLLVSAEDGEWLWRPLENPKELSVTSFESTNPRGFGLVQRDRVFDHYQDIESRFDQRPSAWVVPKGDWGAGRIELVEIPTRDDTNDNIVAYWVPAHPIEARDSPSFAYSVYWYGDDAKRPPGGRAVATRWDEGTLDDARRLIVDFEGDVLRRLPEEAVVEGSVTVVGGKAGEAGAAQPADLLEQQVIRNPATGGFRLVFQLKPPRGEVIELRAFLQHGNDVLSETWSYLLRP